MMTDPALLKKQLYMGQKDKITYFLKQPAFGDFKGKFAQSTLSTIYNDFNISMSSVRAKKTSTKDKAKSKIKVKMFRKDDKKPISDQDYEFDDKDLKAALDEVAKAPKTRKAGTKKETKVVVKIHDKDPRKSAKESSNSKKVSDDKKETYKSSDQAGKDLSDDKSNKKSKNSKKSTDKSEKSKESSSS